MSTARLSPARTPRLLPQVTCPHCWEVFAPEEVLWISEHGDLLGDTRLGPEQMQRFLPTRFNVEGNAIDARGFTCFALACPECHLPVPRCLLEMQPIFMSILGAPASGKSYFLAAMTWELRKVLGQQFSLSFTDADTVANRTLNEYEESLFMNPNSEQLIPLGNLIRKTEVQGEMYDTVMYDQQSIRYPRPFLFSMLPQAAHINAARSAEFARALCLYDNAGESFQPGQDTTAAPVTRHLARASTLFYMFDPTQDSRFRELCQRDYQQTLHSGRGGPTRQEPILQEAAARVRRHAGLRHDQRHDSPLIVVLTKYDSWSHLLDPGDQDEPWREISRGPDEADHPMLCLDVPAIERRSQAARQLLCEICPEIVNSAEAFCSQVYYIPVSAVGWSTSLDDNSHDLAVRPRDARPYWVTVPLLYSLAKWSPGLVPMIQQRE